MHSHKAKAESAKIQKVKIKEEKQDIYPMSYYIGDRVELVKQIFSSLKSKTIKSLAPDFLKNSTIEEIEELCLNELLGISAKRLTAIINATKCPTDTESSTDSDVNNAEDSRNLIKEASVPSTLLTSNGFQSKYWWSDEIEVLYRRKQAALRKLRRFNSYGNLLKFRRARAKFVNAAKYAKKWSSRGELILRTEADGTEHISLEEISSDSEDDKGNKSKSSTAKKNDKKTDNSSSRENDENAREISVLELLELQARARAIRSQLALEPIAKIEVDSDDSTDSDSNTSKKPTVSKNKETDASNALKHNLSNKTKLPSDSGAQTKLETKSKRIKLKRNFRRTQRDEDSEDNEKKSAAEDKNTEENNKTNKVEDSSNEVKREKSPSPDVITILPSPETLCISDSSEDDNKESCMKKTSSESVESKKDIQSNDSTEKELKVEATPITCQATNSKEISNESEVEDGEILEKDEEADVKIQPKDGDNASAQNVNNLVPGESDESTKKSYELKKEILEKTQDCNLHANVSDDHHNDDVISLEHEDLDYEMKDNFAETSKETTSDCLEDKSNKYKLEEKEDLEPIDYIELHDDSSEEENDRNKESGTKDSRDSESQSWNHRWLKSSKVTKILATSKLGNRVREKIKRSKKSNPITSGNEQESIGPKKDFVSQYEDGSVQQYKELLQRDKFNPNLNN